MRECKSPIELTATDERLPPPTKESASTGLWADDTSITEMHRVIDEYFTTSDESGDDLAEAMAGVPVFYRAIRSFDEQIGPMFIEVLAR